MARKSRKLERIEPTDAAMLSLSTEQLLLHSDRRAAADELFRRRFNRYVQRQQA